MLNICVYAPAHTHVPITGYGGNTCGHCSHGAGHAVAGICNHLLLLLLPSFVFSKQLSSSWFFTWSGGPDLTPAGSVGHSGSCLDWRDWARHQPESQGTEIPRQALKDLLCPDTLFRTPSVDEQSGPPLVAGNSHPASTRTPFLAFDAQA